MTAEAMILARILIVVVFQMNARSTEHPVINVVQWYQAVVMICARLVIISPGDEPGEESFCLESKS